MKKLFFFICTFVLTFTFAQNTSSLTFKESAEYRDEVKTNNILSIHTTTSGQTGIIRDSKKNILFDIFDKDLNKVFSKVVESSKKETFVGELFFNDEIKFFTEYASNKTERTIYCHIFNIKEQSLKKVTLFETTVNKNESLFWGKKKRLTNIAISPDGNYVAISTDDIKKDVNSYTIRVFNANTLDIVYTKAYQEDAERYYEHNDMSVDNEATVYSLGKLFLEGRKQKKKGEANYEFILNRITENENKQLNIKLDEDHIQSLNISSINNEIHLLGFFSEKRAGRIKGGCNFIIDTDQFTVKEKRAFNLPGQVYEDLYGYRKAKRKDDKELSGFGVDYVLFDSQGNTYILAEEFYITSQYIYNGNMGGYWSYTYHYDDILILKFSAAGELSWGRSIFKRATSPSYNAFIKDDKLHVILNSGKNLSEKEDGRTKASKGWFESTALFDFVYTADGEVSYDKIQDNKGKTMYIPFYGTFENDSFIMMSDGRTKKQFMILQ